MVSRSLVSRAMYSPKSCGNSGAGTRSLFEGGAVEDDWVAGCGNCETWNGGIEEGILVVEDNALRLIK